MEAFTRKVSHVQVVREALRQYFSKAHSVPAVPVVMAQDGSFRELDLSDISSVYDTSLLPAPPKQKKGKDPLPKVLPRR